MIGIYKLTNLINGKSYIGQSIDIERRIKNHLVYCYEDTSAIHKAVKKYGASNFSWEILEECTIDELDSLERKWIAYYDTYKNGYNLTPGGKDGVGCLDYDTIVDYYLLTGSIKDTAILANCCERTVSHTLKLYNLDKKEIKKCLQEKEKDI